jgi:hypothetical protein
MTSTVRNVLRSASVAISLCAMGTMVPLVTHAGESRININVQEATQGTQIVNINIPPGTQIFINGKPVPGNNGRSVVQDWLAPKNPDGAKTRLNGKSESVLREISLVCPGYGTLYIEGRAYLRSNARLHRYPASLSLKTTTSDVVSTNEYKVKPGGDITGVVVAKYECGSKGENQVVTFSGQGQTYDSANYSLSVTYFSSTD